ncbi:MAG: hypothetical protein ACFE9L_08355 [Candidatus Hodarchaeota archaeon]
MHDIKADIAEVIIRPVRTLWCIPKGKIKSIIQVIRFYSRF